MEPVHNLRLVVQQFDRLAHRRCQRRRNSDREGKSRQHIPQIVNDGLTPGQISAAGTQSLRKGSHMNIHIPGLQVKILIHTAACRPQHTAGVGFIHHQEAPVLLLDPDQPRDVPDVPVHGVGALGDNQYLAELLPSGGKDPVQCSNIVMRKGAACCPAQLASLPNGVMGQRIVNNQIPFSAEIAHKSDVGGMSADQDQCIVAPLPVGNFPLQLTVDGFFPGEQPAAAGGRSVLIDGCLRRFRNFLPSGHPHVVIAGKIQLSDAVHQGGIRQCGIMPDEIGIPVVGNPVHLLSSGQELLILRRVLKSRDGLDCFHLRSPFSSRQLPFPLPDSATRLL